MTKQQKQKQTPQPERGDVKVRPDRRFQPRLLKARRTTLSLPHVELLSVRSAARSL